MNIMVMAGTKDAADIIKMLSNVKDLKILATTTTRYGADIAKSRGADEVISKGLSRDEIIEVIKKGKIDILMDATHPFAVEATRNAIESAKTTGIRYIRFERPKMKLPESDLIHKVSSFEEAASKALELTKSTEKILHLAGVSTLKYIREKIDPSQIFARVLPFPDSIKKCLDLNLKPQNIIAMQGTFTKEFNKALMKEYEISIIITKESGEIGGVKSKIDAALELGLNVVLILRPQVPQLEFEDVFTDLDDLYREMIEK